TGISFIEDDKVYPALEAGAISYMLKTSKAKKIAEAVRDSFKGKSILEPEVAGKMMTKMRKEQPLHETLTAREKEILLCMSEGKTNQAIAKELFISLKTTKVHVSNILAKLQVEDRTQSFIYASQHKLKK